MGLISSIRFNNISLLKSILKKRQIKKKQDFDYFVFIEKYSKKGEIQKPRKA